MIKAFRRGSVPVAIAFGLLACSAPTAAAPAAEPKPSTTTPELIDEADQAVNDLYWTHLSVGIRPLVTATSLYGGQLADGVDCAIAINRGATPADFVQAGVNPGLVPRLIGIAFQAKGDSLVLISTEQRVVSWLPVEFSSTTATGNVLVVRRNR